MAGAQDARWQAHTSLRQVVALSVSTEALWAATSGGVFRYTPNGGELQVYTASEGLHSVQTQTVAYDARRGAVWIGYEDGVLDRVDVESGTVRTFRDIARAERFADRTIHRLLVHGDSLFVATAFGVVVVDPVREEVRDTYARLGSFAPGTAVYDLMIAPTTSGTPGLWLATAEGVAVGSLDTVNLQDPDAWTTETVGIPEGGVRSIAYFNGRVYAGTASGLASRADAGAYESLGVTNTAVNDLTATPARLLGVDRFGLVVVESTGQARTLRASGYENPSAVTVGPAGTVWVADRERGLVAVDIPPAPAQQFEVVQGDVYPEGPYHNRFSDLIVDADGSLWAAGVLASPSFPNTGFYRLDPDGTWESYIAGRVPEMQGLSSFERIHVDAAGTAWAGSAGAGLVQVTKDGAVTVYGSTNSTLRAPRGVSNADYILIGGIASEKDGTLWVTNRAAADPLHVRTPDGEWTGLSGFSCGSFSTSGTTLDRILVDSFGQKWIVVLDEANLRRVLGFLVLDTRGTPADPADDACRFFGKRGSGGQDLPGTTVTSIVEDRDGTVWIGTDNGLAFLINSGVVAMDPSAVPVWPQFADRAQGTFLFYGATVNDLAVDPANRIWVATEQGAHLVEQVAGGYAIVESFTTSNSPLFSNNIVSVAVQPQTGRVYFATDRGLISYEGDAIAPEEQTRDLLVYPNPMRIAEGAEPSVYIEGLVEATELRILASHGEVVARIPTRGGRTRWDGRDLAGRLVPSGVYLVVAVGQNGEGAAYGKVAVIR